MNIISDLLSKINLKIDSKENIDLELLDIQELNTTNNDNNIQSNLNKLVTNQNSIQKKQNHTINILNDVKDKVLCGLDFIFDSSTHQFNDNNNSLVSSDDPNLLDQMPKTELIQELEIKNELVESVLVENTDLKEKIDKLKNKIKENRIQYENTFNEIKIDHDIEINNLKKDFENKKEFLDKEYQNLNDNLKKQKLSCHNLQIELENCNKNLESNEEDNNNKIKQYDARIKSLKQLYEQNKKNFEVNLSLGPMMVYINDPSDLNEDLLLDVDDTDDNQMHLHKCKRKMNLKEVDFTECRKSNFRLCPDCFNLTDHEQELNEKDHHFQTDFDIDF